MKISVDDMYLINAAIAQARFLKVETGSSAATRKENIKHIGDEFGVPMTTFEMQSGELALYIGRTGDLDALLVGMGFDLPANSMQMAA